VDVFRCLSAATGKEKWAHRTPAVGNLDYGNSPRATPLIHDGFAYLQGAFGDLACIELATGKAKWALNVRDEFDAADERKWGVCDSPLIAGGNLIVAPAGLLRAHTRNSIPAHGGPISALFAESHAERARDRTATRRDPSLFRAPR
jgi:outer membrane protein assembly factor BamB